MANERSKDQTVNLGGGNISLDQLVQATSTSVLRALKEHETERAGGGGFIINPRIWVGIWIDLERFRGPGGGPIGGPGGGPGGGPIGGGPGGGPVG